MIDLKDGSKFTQEITVQLVNSQTKSEVRACGNEIGISNGKPIEASTDGELLRVYITRVLRDHRHVRFFYPDSE